MKTVTEFMQTMRDQAKALAGTLGEEVKALVAQREKLGEEIATKQLELRKLQPLLEKEQAPPQTKTKGKLGVSQAIRQLVTKKDMLVTDLIDKVEHMPLKTKSKNVRVNIRSIMDSLASRGEIKRIKRAGEIYVRAA